MIRGGAHLGKTTNQLSSSETTINCQIALQLSLSPVKINWFSMQAVCNCGGVLACMTVLLKQVIIGGVNDTPLPMTSMVILPYFVFLEQCGQDGPFLEV